MAYATLPIELGQMRQHAFSSSVSKGLREIAIDPSNDRIGSANVGIERIQYLDLTTATVTQVVLDEL